MANKVEKKLLKSEELINRIVEAAGEEGLKLTKKDTKVLVETVFSVLSKALEEQHQIIIKQFGTFATKIRAARTVSKPGTTEKIDLPESRAASFKASSALKEKVNLINTAKKSKKSKK